MRGPLRPDKPVLNPVGLFALLVYHLTRPGDNKGTDEMANTPQAKKRARQNEARFAINKMRRSRIRTHLRAVEEAIASGDPKAAAEALKACLLYTSPSPRD